MSLLEVLINNDQVKRLRMSILSLYFVVQID